jgi:hypothetical protein
MSMAIHPASIAVVGLALAAGMLAPVFTPVFTPAWAQDENPTTPGAIPNPGTYQGSMALQQQEQQQYQQQEQQNQQMQQRLDRNYQQYAPQGGMGGGGPPPVNWFAKPALAPDKNPLLGRWHQVARPQAQNALMDMVGTMMGGGCDSIFGKGTVAFEPNALQWVAPDGHEEILNHVAYRANGNDVVMITRDPGAIPALFFGFTNRDHAVVGILGCRLERAGARQELAPAPPGGGPAPSASASAAPGSASGGGKAVLNFTIGASAPGSLAPMSGVQMWVTREDPEAALLRAGFPRGGSLASRLYADCHVPANCMRDWQAMTSTALGSIRTDASGHAQTPSIPAGRYYLVGMAPYQSKALFWRLPVDLKPGANGVVLDQTNASVFQ